MCDVGSAWDVIARAPGALVFTSAFCAFAAPTAFPGGSAPFLAAMIGVAILARAIKALTVQMGEGWAFRPDIGLPASPGFPSSHTMIITFAAAAFCVTARRVRKAILAALLALLAVLVGVSRYVTKCHSPLQIWAGAAFGVTIGVLYGVAANE